MYVSVSSKKIYNYITRPLIDIAHTRTCFFIHLPGCYDGYPSPTVGRLLPLATRVNF